MNLNERAVFCLHTIHFCFIIQSNIARVEFEFVPGGNFPHILKQEIWNKDHDPGRL